MSTPSPSSPSAPTVVQPPATIVTTPSATSPATSSHSKQPVPVRDLIRQYRQAKYTARDFDNFDEARHSDAGWCFLAAIVLTAIGVLMLVNNKGEGGVPIAVSVFFWAIVIKKMVEADPDKPMIDVRAEKKQLQAQQPALAQEIVRRRAELGDMPVPRDIVYAACSVVGKHQQLLLLDCGDELNGRILDKQAKTLGEPSPLQDLQGQYPWLPVNDGEDARELIETTLAPAKQANKNTLRGKYQSTRQRQQARR